METVDVGLYRFDFDLTFATLIMNADGTIYHRFGGRDYRDASDYLSMKGLVRLMKDAVADHQAYQKNPTPPKKQPKKTIRDYPAWVAKGNKPKCIHCHMINDAERLQAQKESRWSTDDIWLWPLPDRLGLKVDADDQTLVKEAKSDLKPGDRILRMNGASVRTLMDMQAVLESISKDGGVLAIDYQRGGKDASASIKLKKGWKTGTPLDLSWRPSMWGLRPAPGFGGKRLTEEELKKEGLSGWAMRIGYIVDWGDQAHLGKNVKAAGLQKGDVIVSIDGKNDFFSEMHFQTWFRLTFKPGSKVKIDYVRGGKRQSASLPVIE